VASPIPDEAPVIRIFMVLFLAKIFDSKRQKCEENAMN
jgi:hypothetical protein